MTKQDIAGREEIEELVRAFYAKARKDDQIGVFFNEVVEIDWDHHVPLICDFWESTLFHNAKYQGNPMTVHVELSKKKRLEKPHFERWLALWQETVEEMFAGPVADLAKSRGSTISILMNMKVQEAMERLG